MNISYVGLVLSYAQPNVCHSILYAVLIQQLANLHSCLYMYVSEETIVESETELVQYQSESAQQCEERLRRRRAEC